MAFTVANLRHLDGPPGEAMYIYKSDTDSRATVATSGYFNNSDDNQNLVSDDMIYVTGNQGFYCLRIDVVTAGACTTEDAGGTTWLTAELTDVSTASSTWLVAPFDSIVGRFKTILHGAIATADADLSIELAGTDMTGSVITIATSSSAAGDVDETVCTALNVVAEGTAIEIDTDGASTNTIAVTCMVEFIPA